MRSDRRGRGGLARGTLVAFFLIGSTSACTPIIGGTVLVGLVAVGALTSRCYDYLDVSVFDGEGRKTCAAKVTASKGGSQVELTSCYYAPLTDGRWTLRPSLPGLPDALSTVNVEHAHDCTRNVQTVELTLKPAAAPQVPPAAPATPPPVALPAVDAAPATPPIGPGPSPEAVPSASAQAPPPPSPASSAAPSVGVFPDQPPPQ